MPRNTTAGADCDQESSCDGINSADPNGADIGHCHLCFAAAGVPDNRIIANKRLRQHHMCARWEGKAHSLWPLVID